MAIGTAAALLASAVIGAGASTLNSSSAAHRAADASDRATDASVGVQNRALDLQQQNTAQARTTGDQAIRALGDRLGLTTPTQASSATAGQGSDVDWEAYLNQGEGDISREADRVVATGEFPSRAAYAQSHWQRYGQNEGRIAPAPAKSTFDPSQPQAPGPPAILESQGPIDAEGSYTGQRPNVGPAPVYEAPTYRETAVAPLDVSLGKYEQSPDYEFQLSEGNRNILANASATGALESGAALKALQKFGQDLALGDYGQWRDYTTGQYNQDRSFTANRDDAANSFAGAQAQNVFNAANNTYQYGNTLAQNMFNSDRDYNTGRYDTRTNNLLSLAGYGQNAAGQYGNALSNNASALSNGYFGNAQNQGNAALASAGQTNSAISSGVNALAYYYGNKPGTSAGSPASSRTWQMSDYGDLY